ncbi:hypothetical protein AB0F71_12740 [Kitasatospora sp. NPDC028055]|uniref:hypothetical protein n=1 Tax=Kitasatospora sp. NPDC028055 TaxID=3155653 RepID=UPI0033EA110D
MISQVGRVESPADPEVDDARTVPGDQHVARLEVTVCTTPTAWIAASTSASAAPNARVPASPSGPNRSTASPSYGAARYAVAIHGWGPRGCASTTGGVWNPVTRLAASTSCWNRRWNCGSGTLPDPGLAPSALGRVVARVAMYGLELQSTSIESPVVWEPPGCAARESSRSPAHSVIVPADPEAV